MIVVFDASSLVGAALGENSIPERALLLAMSEGRTLLLSKAVAGEYLEVLSRPKFARTISIGRRQQILGIIERFAERVEPGEAIAECRDPGDDKYLALAAAGGADVIVSSDRDLLEMDRWRGIRVLRPAEFIALA